MDKLICITRSNLDVHQFCILHGIDESNVIIVKSLGDLTKVNERNYVILPPGPRNFHWTIRPYLILNKFVNKSKYYNKKLNKF